MIRIVTVSGVPEIRKGINSYFSAKDNNEIKCKCRNHNNFIKNKLQYNSNDSYYFLFDFYETKKVDSDLFDLIQFDYKRCLKSIKDKEVICKGVIVFAYNTWDTIRLYEQFDIINRLFTQNEIVNAHCIETSHIFSRIPEKRIYKKDPKGENLFNLGNPGDLKDYGQLIGSIVNSLISQETTPNPSSDELKYLHKNSLNFNEYISNLNSILPDSEFKLSTYSFIVNETSQYLIDWPFKEYYKPQNDYITGDRITGDRKLNEIFKKIGPDKSTIVDNEYLEGCNFYYLDYCINNNTNTSIKLKQIISFNEALKDPMDIFKDEVWYKNEENLFNDWQYILSTSIFFRADLLQKNKWESEKCEGCSISCTNDCRNYRIGIYWFMHKAETIETYKLHGLFTYTFYQLLKPEDPLDQEKIAKNGKELYNKYRPLIETKAKETLFPYLYSQTKSAALQSTSSRLINRNSAHHLISHCEPYVTFQKISSFLGWNNFWNIPERFLQTVETMRERYRKYVNDRNTFMSQDLHNLGSVNASFYQDIIGPLIENTLWVDGIARDEAYGYDIIPLRVNNKAENLNYDDIDKHWSVSSKNNLIFGIKHIVNKVEKIVQGKYKFSYNFFKKESECIESCISNELPYFLPEIEKKIENDVQIALPGSLGAQSFYSIVENHVRNLVKHKKPECTKKPLVIKIEIKEVNKDEIKEFEEKMYKTAEIPKSDQINHTLKRSEELYQVELSSNLATLTEEEYKSLVGKVLNESDLSDYDNIAKGLADIRLNAMLLSGAELKSDNPELKTCLLVASENENCSSNYLILKYIFFIRKPYIAVQIGDLFGIAENRANGFYKFNNIEAYRNFLGNKQCPFGFMLTTIDIEEQLKAKEKPLKIINIKEDIKDLKDELSLWTKYSEQRQFIGKYQLCSNNVTGNNTPSEINNKNNNPFATANNIIAYDRHGCLSGDSYSFWELIGKANRDFDIIDYEFNNNKASLYHEMAYAAVQRILIIDERVSGFCIDKFSKGNKKIINQNKRNKCEMFYHALSANIDIVTHFDEFCIQPNQQKKIGVLKWENNQLMLSNNEDKNQKVVNYDIVIIHRKLVDQFVKFILKDNNPNYKDFIDKIKDYSKQVYITTGSGSISDLKELANEYKYIPFSVLEGCLKNSIMKISLLRNL